MRPNKLYLTDIVWQTATVDVPNLREEVSQILAEDIK